MGILDAIKSRVVMEYRADVDQAKVALRELAGEEKKTAQAAIQGVEDRIKAHENLAGKIAASAAIVGGVVALGVAGWKTYEEQSRLAAATASISIDKIRTASRGLMTDLDLMQVAAEGANGKWHLSTAEMENVLGAARALELRGIAPLSEAAKKLGEAVRKGEVDPLKELGIAYDENLAKTDKRAAAMKALTELSKESAHTATTEGEAIRQTGVEFRNSVDGIVTAIGQLVVALGPLLNAAGSLIGFVSKSVQGWSMLFDKIAGGGGGPVDVGPLQLGSITLDNNDLFDFAEKGFGGRLGKLWDATVYGLQGEQIDHRQSMAAAAAAQPAIDAENRRRREDQERRITIAGRNAARYAEARRTGDWSKVWASMFPGEPMPHGWRPPGEPARVRSGGGGGGGYAVDVDTQGQGMQVFNPLGAIGSLGGLFGLDSEQGTVGQYGLLGSLSGGLDIFGGETRPQFLAESARGQFGKVGGMGVGGPRKPSLLERMMGPVEEFDVYKTAWGTLQDAIAGGYEALVSGSESAGAAMKRIVGQAIMAEGSHMAILALREGAMAVAALARGNIPEATTHGVAALKFTAGAVAAGIAAHELGAGGSTTSAASSGGAAASGGATGVSLGGDSRPVINNYILGDAFAFESSREQAARFRLASRNADRFQRPPEGVGYA